MSPGGSTLLFGALPKQIRFSAEEKRTLKDFAGVLADRLVEGRAFTCLITNDDEVRKLNHRFLNHDCATDVLSFPCTTNGDLGEMIISAERAEAQAFEFGHGRIDEIRILMLHGLLHLSGMDHQRDRGEMARAERKWRSELRLPATLIARAAAPRAIR